MAPKITRIPIPDDTELAMIRRFDPSRLLDIVTAFHVEDGRLGRKYSLKQMKRVSAPCMGFFLD